MLVLLLICGFLGVSFSYRRPLLRTYRNEISFRLFAGFGKPNKESVVSSTSMKPHSESMCKCNSDSFYGDCCEKFHNQSEFPESPINLVRSRFCAYAIGNWSYIMETTHPSHKEYASTEQSTKRKNWQKSLMSFTKDYEFKSLEFPSTPNPVSINATVATVAFQAKIKRKTTSVDPVLYPMDVINELSTFKRDKLNTRWLYSGKFCY